MAKPEIAFEGINKYQTKKLPSNRSVAFVISGAIALIPYFLTGHVVLWALIPAIGLIILALVSESSLTPLTRAWMGLAEKMAMIVSPIILSILFFLVFTPFGFFYRLLGNSNFKGGCSKTDHQSYWIIRKPSPSPQSMRHQF